MEFDAIRLAKQIGGKIEIKSKKRLTKRSLPILYTPGVAQVSAAIAGDKKLAFDYTIKKDTVAVVSDGSAVLGLGNVGPEAALPVMEGKAVLFKELAGINAAPIVLATQDADEIVKTVKAIAPAFGGINLEDISAPRCFEIEEKLKRILDIPVFHDDQHGTAIVVLAGLINALKVVKKKRDKIKVAISGAGAAGTAVASLLLKYGVKNIIVCDSVGAIFAGRKERMNWAKKELAKITNLGRFRGSLKDALKGADVFIGVSAPDLLRASDIRKMNERPIVFAMANPIPEIMPAEAKRGGAAVVATGRSDFPNQLNNVLAFPGIFKGALEKREECITDVHKLRSAIALAALVKKSKSDKIIPNALDRRAVSAVAKIFRNKP